MIGCCSVASFVLYKKNFDRLGRSLCISQCRSGSVQFWVALFVEASKQIEHIALRTVKDSFSVILIN